MPVLQIKDENGKFIPIPAIKGDKGDINTFVINMEYNETSYCYDLVDITVDEIYENLDLHKIPIIVAEGGEVFSGTFIPANYYRGKGFLEFGCNTTYLNTIVRISDDGEVGMLADKMINETSLYEHVPTGIICMWSGDTIPTGWALCDGGNGTPDLSDRFIVGSGNEYAIGDTGGEKEHTLTIDEIPPHSHIYIDNYLTANSSGIAFNDEGYSYAQRTIAHKNTSVVGGDEDGNMVAHNNLPPYYALAFIIKL